MTSEEFECQKCGKVTPISVCPNCGKGTVWKHAIARGRMGMKMSLSRLEARSKNVDRVFAHYSTFDSCICLWLSDGPDDRAVCRNRNCLDLLIRRSGSYGNSSSYFGEKMTCRGAQGICGVLVIKI